MSGEAAPALLSESGGFVPPVPIGTASSFSKKELMAKCHASPVSPEALVGTGPRNCKGMRTSPLGTERSTEAGLLEQAEYHSAYPGHRPSGA